MKIRALLALPCAMSLAVSVSGCSYLFGDDGVFRDTSGDYTRAEETEPLELPPGLRSARSDEIYAVPEIESEPQFRRGNNVPRPAPLVAASAEQMVRIQRLGDDSWALIAIAPGQLWPQLRNFLSAANIDIARMDARAGIIDSTYLDLSNRTQQSRFRFRIERGVQRGNSELHILQMHRKSEDEWPENSDDADLEAEMLRGVAQYIANSADTAGVSMMAEQSISSSARVTLDEDDAGDLIRLELPFDRAWASVARSLDLSGFQITDRNRSEGLYYITYVGEEDEKKSGWFGWMSGGEDKHPAQDIPLLLSMEAADGGMNEIRLRTEQSAAVDEQDLLSLLVLIKGNIN